MLTHPELGTAIAILYPSAQFFTDYTVEAIPDQGPSLVFWDKDKLGPEPDLKSIEKALKEHSKTTKTKEFCRNISHEFIEAYFEAQLSNPEPMNRLLETYKASKTK